MPLPTLILILNSVLLLLAFFLSIRMLRAGTQHTLNFGDAEAQDRMKWIILRCIVAMVVIGIIAAVFNLAQLFFTV